MAKIKNLSHWGQAKARERYQIGGPIAGGFVPPQAIARPALPVTAAPQAALAARPAMPVQAMGRRPFKKGGKVKHKQVGGQTDFGPNNVTSDNVSPDTRIRFWESYSPTRDPAAGWAERAGGLTGMVQGAKDLYSDAADTLKSIGTGKPGPLGTTYTRQKMRRSTEAADTQPEGRKRGGKAC